MLTLSLPASACSPFAVERMAALLQQTDDPVSLVSGFVSFVEGQLTLEPRVMMTKPALGRWTQKLRLWHRYLLPAFCLCRLPLISC